MKIIIEVSLLAICCIAYSQSFCIDAKRNCAKNGQPDCESPFRATVTSIGTQKRRNRTVSGLRCQKWNTKHPHQHKFSHIGDHNFCQNPDGEAGPWCYTEDPSVRWEFCFETCQDNHNNPCVNEEGNCALNGEATCKASYVGTLTDQGYTWPATRKNTTRSGIVCQHWSQKSPHKHYFSRTGNHNFCSNPDGELGPWCYTVDSSVRWEYCYDTCENAESSPQSFCVDTDHNCAINGQPECESPFTATLTKSGTKISRNTTTTGLRCQKWTSQQPHQHKFSHIGDNNLCRNPDGEAGPWCYTEDPNVRWEFCFETCQDDITTPCVDEERDCAKNGEVTCKSSYLAILTNQGYQWAATTKNRTVSGRLCQHWSWQTPHKHSFHRTGKHNLCSNPDGELGPWCYTTDSAVRWEYCYDTCGHEDSQSQSFPQQFCIDANGKCSKNGQPECTSKFTAPSTNTGKQTTRDVTASGLRCQSWSSQEPHKHKFQDVGNHNFCRNPDEEYGPWCYTGDPNVRWEYCFPTCRDGKEPSCVKVKQNCAKNGAAQCRNPHQATLTDEGHEAKKTTTASGRTCQRWSDQKPHQHEFSSLLGTHNFCSNPDETKGPWCYTTDSAVRWEYCYDTCGMDKGMKKTPKLSDIIPLW